MLRRVKNKMKKKSRGKIIWIVLGLFLLGYLGYNYYYENYKPYTIVLDPGHGGEDPGAIGIVSEVEVTEATVKELARLLNEDGRFRVLISREYGENLTITDRNRNMQRINPDIMLSIHANASEHSQANGFECFPSPPTMSNYTESMMLAQFIIKEMGAIGANIRGENGIKYGYYMPVEGEVNVYQKLLVDSNDMFLYPYDTFGVLMDMEGASVLVEQGFVTNEGDVDLFMSEQGISKSALIYYNAICEYLDVLSEME